MTIRIRVNLVTMIPDALLVDFIVVGLLVDFIVVGLLVDPLDGSKLLQLSVLQQAPAQALRFSTLVLVLHVFSTSGQNVSPPVCLPSSQPLITTTALFSSVYVAVKQ